MKKPNLGQKQTCRKCEARFFDMNKNPAVCPKCGEAYKTTKSKARRVAPPPQVAATGTPDIKAGPVAANAPETASSDGDIKIDGIAAAAETDDDDDLEAELEGDQDDDGLMEDTSDIGEDSDELSEVLEHVDDGVGDK